MSNCYSYQFVKVDPKDSVAVLTMNRPETLNAATMAVHHEAENFQGR